MDPEPIVPPTAKIPTQPPPVQSEPPVVIIPSASRGAGFSGMRGPMVVVASVLIVLFVIGGSAVAASRFLGNPLNRQKAKTTNTVINTINSPTPTIASGVSTVPPTSTPVVSTTKSPTPALKNSPTPTAVIPTVISSSCNYNLTSATGAITINSSPQTGLIKGKLTGEIKATSGCKVLDGKSTDTQTLLGSQGSKYVTFSSVPPGTYAVRLNYNGSWYGSNSATVTSGQTASTSFSIPGDQPDPTATPTPAPVVLTCQYILGMPSTQGPAPLTVSLCTSNNGAGPTNGYSSEWDFDNNGSFEFTGDMGCQSKTFSSAGSYTVNARFLSPTNQYSNTCSVTVTAQ